MIEVDRDRLCDGSTLCLFILVAFSVGNVGCKANTDPSRPQLIEVRESYDSSHISMAPGLTMPSEDAGYTLLLPRQDPKGLIVSFNSGRDTSHIGYEMRMYVPAIRSGFAMAFVTTGNPFEFLFEEKRYRQLDRYIHEIQTSHGLSDLPMMFVGMSLAGTRALKFAIWCARGNSAHQLRAAAIAICDAPLDFVRFWDDGNIAQTYQTNPLSVGEATWVNHTLAKNLGGTPHDAHEAFVEYSPFHKALGLDQRLVLLDNIPIRCYTEPDIQWWMKNRQKSYFGMNAIDAAGLVNQLQLLGNSQAELIATTNRGYRPDGTRHPHTWGIVDQEELMFWFKGLQ